MNHLCDKCIFEFPTCEGLNIVFGIDLDSALTGKAADTVISCLSHRERKEISVCMNFNVSDNLEMIQKIEKGIDKVLDEFGFSRTITGKGEVCLFMYKERGPE